MSRLDPLGPIDSNSYRAPEAPAKEAASKGAKEKIFSFFKRSKDNIGYVLIEKKGPVQKFIKHVKPKGVIIGVILTGIVNVKKAVEPLFKSMGTAAGSAVTTGGSVLDQFKPLAEKASGLSYLSALFAPLSFFNIAMAIKNLVIGSPQEKIEAAFSLAENTGDVGKHATTAGAGLEQLGYVAQTGLNWSFGFGIAAGVVSAISIAFQSWSLHRTYQYLEKTGLKTYLEKSGTSENIEESFKEVTEKLIAMDKSLLKKNFKTGADRLKGRLQDISKIANEKIKSGIAEEVEEGKEMMRKTLSNLASRVDDKVFSHKLGIIIGVVSLVALGILLFTPLAPLAYTIMAIGAILTVSMLVYEHVRKKRFKEAMGIMKPDAPKLIVDENPVPEPRVVDSETRIKYSTYHQSLLAIKNVRAAV